MLTQALQSVQATMQATGQSPAQLTGPNQNLAQAAQGVVSGEKNGYFQLKANIMTKF